MKANSAAKAVQLLGVVARADGVLKLHDLRRRSVAEIDGVLAHQPAL